MEDQITQISLDLIIDPNIPMRSQMDEEKLDELAASIKTHGLIQPITLRKVGEMYEVVAGHRRTKAARRAGLVTISAIVRELSDADTDGMRMHENLYREDINPVDEGRYIRKMVDIHHVEPHELALMTGKSEAYLKARYELLDYPDYLIEAVESEKVSLTAAKWLSQIDNDKVRMEYTRFAILGGITAKRAEAWYRSWSAGSLPPEATEYVAQPVGDAPPERKMYAHCALCRNEDDLDNMTMEYVHAECAKAVASMNG